MSKLVQMDAYKIGEIDFKNQIQGKVRLKLKNKVGHNVKFSPHGYCEASTTVEVFDENHKEDFHIKVTVSGIFKFLSEGEKEFVHVETFNELFPFAKTFITTISANAGIAPIIIDNVDIETQEIYRFEMGKKDDE